MNQREIAKLAGVSSATISRVINDDPSVSEETRKHVQEIIEKYSYVTNVNARNLRMSRSKTIGFLISNFSNPFFVSIYQGMEKVCSEKGYNIIIGITNEKMEQQKKAIDLFLSYQVSGIIGSFVDLDEPSLKKLRGMKRNVILLDRQIRGIDADTIEIDNEGGAVQQVNYLADLGHRRIAVIHGKKDSPGTSRLDGYYQGMKQKNISIPPEYVICGNYNERDAYYAAVQLLQLPDPPTAIIAHNNLMCIGAYKAIRDLGKKIPTDISLIGFDNFDFANYLEPGITLIDRPVDQMGEMAAKMIFERLEYTYTGEARKIVLPVKLKISESCGANFRK